MLSALAKKTSIKNGLKWVLGGFSLFFIGMLFFMLVHDSLTGASLQTAEHCAKYGFLASPDCW
jgi:hypothetical protein